MDKMHTNKEVLGKGVQNLAISLIFLFGGPFILHLGFKLHNFLTIGIGVILLFTAMFFIFKGIRYIMKALFND